MKSYRILCLVTLYLASIPIYSQETNRISNLPKLNIKRSGAPPEPLSKEISRTVKESGLIEAHFLVPPNFLASNLADTFMVKDPFAPAPEKAQPGPSSPCQAILEKNGIFFGPDAAATYKAATSTLTVLQTPEQMELVKMFVEALSTIGDRNVVVRAEIYELPALTCLEAIESAAKHGNHTPERDAILEMVRNGKARLVNVLTSPGRSGNRCKIEDVSSFVAFAGFEWKEPSGKQADEKEVTKEAVSIWKEKSFGTILEIDPVLGTDNSTIDLNFALEHHTAAPEMVKKKLLIPEKKEYREVEIPQFHVKKITTQITMRSGNYQLIGNWRPTGDPKYAEHDLMQIAFILSKVVPTYDVKALKPGE